MRRVNRVPWTPENYPMSENSNVTVEDVGPSRKKLTITVPSEAISEQVETSFATLAHDVELPGFRKGRAPRRLIEKRFGDNVRSEARNQLVSSAYSKAIQENNLAVIGEPEGADELEDIDLSTGEGFTFTVEIDVAPDFELPELDGIKVYKPLLEVEDSHVEEQLEKMKINEGELIPRDKAEPDDYCIGRGVITLPDGTEALAIDDAVIQIPDEGEQAGAVLGVKVDDFAKQVGNPKPGDTITINAKGPENHETEEIRGQDIAITFDVAQVQRIEPATVEDLVSKYGMTDEQQLREAITLRLNQSLHNQQQSAMRQQITKYLLDNIEFVLPERLTAQQASQNVERRRAELQYQGMDDHEIEAQLAEIRSQSHEQARQDLKAFFILSKIANDLQIQVSEQEIGSRIVQMASERGMRPEDLRDRLVQSNGIQMLGQQIREHKALDQLTEKADVEEVSPEEFSEKVAEAG